MIDLLLGDSGYGLSIEIEPFVACIHLSFISPSLETKLKIAYHNDTHSKSYALRWDEVSLIHWAIESTDLEHDSFHSDVLLFFLSRFAVICASDNDDAVGAIARAMDKAHDHLNVFSYYEIRGILESYDARNCGFRWRYDDVLGTWCLQQYPGRTSARGFYSSRVTSDNDFPFETWPLMLAAAGQSIAVSGGRKRNDQRYLSPEYYFPREFKKRRRYDFDLTISSEDKKRPLFRSIDLILPRFIDRVPADFDLGHAHLGELLHGTAAGGRIAKVEFRVSVRIRGDLDHGTQLIREMLWWAGVPGTITHQNCDFRTTPFSIAEGPSQGPSEALVELGRFGTPFPSMGDEPLEGGSLPHSCHTLLRAAIENRQGTGPDENGWYTISLADGEVLKASFNKVKKDPENDLNTIILRKPSPETAQFLYSLMLEGDLVLFPIFIAASAGITENYKNQRDCPRVKVISSASELHGILIRGVSLVVKFGPGRHQCP